MTLIDIIKFAISLAIYFLPTIVARTRDHHSGRAIFYTNLLLGWTIIGWVIAFIWSFTNPVQVIVNNQKQQSAADEIQKLAILKEQGLLTEDEFTKKKQQLLENT